MPTLQDYTNEDTTGPVIDGISRPRGYLTEKYEQGPDGRGAIDFSQQAQSSATVSAGAFSDNVRVLPRTNLVKRLRSITFMLILLDPKTLQEQKILFTHTLLIAPQSYQQTEPNRSTVVQTLGGAFIDDFGLGLKQITISGTTGFASRLVREEPVGSLTPKAAQITAMDGYHAFKRLRDNIYRAYFTSSEEQKPTDITSVGTKTDTTVAGALRNRLPGMGGNDAIGDASGLQLARYANGNRMDNPAINDPATDTKYNSGYGTLPSEKMSLVRLKMFYWANEDYFVVHPLSFSFSQSADESLLYRYNMEFIVIQDLNSGDATKAYLAASKDPFTSLIDARNRSVLANQQITNQILYQIVLKNYVALQGIQGTPEDARQQASDRLDSVYDNNGGKFIGDKYYMTAWDEVTNADTRTLNDPYYTAGDLGTAGRRDWAGVVYTPSDDAARRAKMSYALSDVSFNATKPINGSYSVGTFRLAVVQQSLNEAKYRNLDVTEADVNATFDEVERLRGNYPSGYGNVSTGWRDTPGK